MGADPISGKPVRIVVEKGPVMYASLVTEDSPVVRLLKSACEAMLGEAPETFYGQSAHDQGYLNAVGIPTANFGSGEQAFAHTDLDMASVDKTFDAAKVYAWMIATYLGAGATAGDCLSITKSGDSTIASHRKCK